MKGTMQTPKRLISPKKAAEYLPYAESYIREKLCKDGTLTTCKIGRKLGITVESIVALQQKHMPDKPSDKPEEKTLVIARWNAL